MELRNIFCGQLRRMKQKVIKLLYIFIYERNKISELFGAVNLVSGVFVFFMRINVSVTTKIPQSRQKMFFFLEDQGQELTVIPFKEIRMCWQELENEKSSIIHWFFAAPFHPHFFNFVTWPRSFLAEENQQKMNKEKKTSKSRQ